jgi:hypothetical protein
MNDNDLLPAIRESFGQVRMDRPAEAVMTRGRLLRRRRRGWLSATALAAALGTGLSVPAVSAGNGTQNATLTAWTVQRESSESIAVTIRDLHDLPGLQARLTSYGVRATIGSSALTLPRTCLDRPNENPLGQLSQMISFGKKAHVRYYFVIHPDGIPANKVLRIVIIPAGSDQPPSSVSDKTVTSPGMMGLKYAGYPAVLLAIVPNVSACTS